jgi:hypothetical protein
MIIRWTLKTWQLNIISVGGNRDIAMGDELLPYRPFQVFKRKQFTADL